VTLVLHVEEFFVTLNFVLSFILKVLSDILGRVGKESLPHLCLHCEDGNSFVISRYLK
jgi:hypothetical protein